MGFAVDLRRYYAVRVQTLKSYFDK